MGGVPRFENQADCNAKVRELFAAFNVLVVSKVHPFYEARGAEESDNKHYTFVDLASAKEVEQAVAALDGTKIWGGTVKVQASKSHSGRLKERQRLFVAGLPEFEDQAETEEKIRGLFKGYELNSISKLFLPKDEAKKSDEGNHCYCFVELKDEVDTDKAQQELDWKDMWGGVVRVKSAYSAPDRGIREKTHWRS